MDWRMTCKCGVVVALLLMVAIRPASAQEPKQVDAAAKKLMAAGGLFERELYDMARQEYAEFLDAWPDHPDIAGAQYGLAVCRYKLGEYGKTAARLAPLAADKEFAQREEALAVLGHCYQTTKAFDKALATIDRLLADYPKSTHVETARLNRAQVLYMLDRKEESTKACEQFIADYSEGERLATAYYFLALSLHDRDEHERAIKTLGELIKRFPDSPELLDAILLMGRTYEQKGKHEDASAQYRQLIRKAEGIGTADGMYTLAVALHKVGEYKAAVEQLKRMLEKFADSEQAAPARLQLGMSQLAAGDTDAARRTFDTVAAKDEKRQPTANYWKAQADITDKRYESALTILDELAKLDPAPDNIEAVLFDRGSCLMSLERFGPAAEQFAALQKQFPKGSQATEALYRQAFCLHKMKLYDKSQQLCQRLARLPQSPLTGPAMELTAENFFLLKDYAAAEGVYTDLLKRADAEDAVRYTYRLGQCAYFDGDYRRAVARLAPLLKDADPAGNELLSDALFLLGDAQLQLGQYEPAEKSLGRYVGMASGRNLEAQFKYALTKVRSPDPDEALDMLRKVMHGPQDSPWVRRAWFEYGQLAYQHKRYDESQEVLQEALTLGAAGDLAASSLYLLGWIDFDRQRYVEAAERFRQVTEEYADHELAVEAAFQRAAALKDAGQTEQALGLFEAYVKQHPDAPNSASSRHLIGACLLELGRTDQAVKLLESLAKQDSDEHDGVLYDLAWAYRSAEDIDKSVATYRQMLKQHPDSSRTAAARTELAELLYLSKQYKDAAALLELVVATKDVDLQTLLTASYRLGWCYSHLGQHDQSAKVFLRFAHDYSENELSPSALFQGALAQIAAEQYDPAGATLDTLRNQNPNHELASVALLKLGEIAAVKEEYEQSRQLYQQYLRDHDDGKFKYLALFGMGWSYDGERKYDDARKWYRKVIDAHNGETAARAQFQIGETWYAQGEHAKAARELLKVDIIYAYPQWSAPALYEAGRAFEQLKQMDQARRQYKQCVERGGDQPEAELAAKRLAELEN